MTYNRPSSCKLSFKRAYLMTNIAAFSASDTSILTPCFDGIVHTYATSQELIKSVFGQNFQNMITAVRIQLTITLLIKLQKWLLSTIFVYLFQWLIRPFWLPLRMELRKCMCHIRNWGKKGIYRKFSKFHQSSWHELNRELVN